MRHVIKQSIPTAEEIEKMTAFVGGEDAAKDLMRRWLAGDRAAGNALQSAVRAVHRDKSTKEP